MFQGIVFSQEKPRVSARDKNTFIYVRHDIGVSRIDDSSETIEYFKEGGSLKGRFSIYNVTGPDNKCEGMPLSDEEIKDNVIFKMLKNGVEIKISPEVKISPEIISYHDDNTDKDYFYEYEINVSDLSPGEYDFYISYMTDKKIIYGLRYGKTKLSEQDYYKFRKIKIKEAITPEEKDEALLSRIPDLPLTVRHYEPSYIAKIGTESINSLQGSLEGKLKTDKYRIDAARRIYRTNMLLDKSEDALAWLLCILRHANDLDNFNSTASGALSNLILRNYNNKLDELNNKHESILQKAEEIDNKYFPDLKPFKDWKQIGDELNKRCKIIKENQEENLKREEEYKEWVKMIAEKNEDTYRDLIIYLDDKVIERQNIAYNKLREIGLKSENKKIKTEIADLLFSRIKTEDRFSFDDINRIYLFDLSSYLSDDTKNQVLKNLAERNVLQRPYTLAGELNLVEAKPILLKDLNSAMKPDYDNPIFKEYLVSTIRRVLARMGDKEKIDEYLKSSKKRTEDNPELLKELTYIRQPETVNLLINYLSSNIDKYDAMKCLSDCIIDFPVKYDERIFSEKTHEEENKVIEDCRKWIKENYNPRKIKSHSVLIDGKIYDNIGKDSEGKTPESNPDEKKK